MKQRQIYFEIFIAGENFPFRGESELVPLLFFDVPILWSPLVPPF